MAEIRQLTSQDAAAFRSLRLTAQESEPCAFLGTAREYDNELFSVTGQSLSRLNYSNDDVLLGAFDEGLIGTAGLSRESREKRRHLAVLWGLFVRPERREGELAERLVRDLLDHAGRMTGLEQVQARVGSAAPHHGELLLRAGFRKIGEEPRAIKIDGVYFDVSVLLLELPVRP